MINSGIYRIINISNGHCYIGSAVNLYNRKQAHFSNLRKNKHKNAYLQNAFNLYKEHSFIFDIVEYCISNVLINREQFFMDSLKIAGVVLYNLCPVSGSRLGTKSSNETKKKLSGITKGMKNPFYGKRHREESKKKMSEANKGRPISTETRRKLVEANKYKNVDRIHSEESRKNMSEAHKGQIPWNKGKAAKTARESGELIFKGGNND